MMKMPTCALPSALLSGLRKVAAFRSRPAVVQVASVVHTTVVVIARASLEYPTMPTGTASIVNKNKNRSDIKPPQ